MISGNNGQSYCQQVEKGMNCDLEAWVFKKLGCPHVQTGLLSSHYKWYVVKKNKQKPKTKKEKGKKY